ncbi:MAG TPA: sensor histidine kinase [Clostridiales bacterium]|nr:sensor histidine kinase [Clostridiales bacterium]
MKELNKAFIAVTIIITAIIMAANIFLPSVFSVKDARQYQVEISRAANDIKRKNQIDLTQYPSIKKITKLTDEDNLKDFIEGENKDYVIKIINDEWYRFDYTSNVNMASTKVIIFMNSALIVVGAIALGFVWYIKVKIICPFNKIYNLPYELAKGNLSSGIKEDKSRYFGKFLWGLDMLRETLEARKKRELELQKEKKTIILSISHDIKTPLSAIKLYSKAIEKNLYDTEQGRLEIARNINEKADEIERHITDIIKSSNENILDFKVNAGEFYLSDLIDDISSYYKEKLMLIKTEFIINKYDNCIVHIDLDKTIETMQNIIENAIKYGDGRYIKIHFSQEENCRIITISNSGCSLLDEEIPHIFDSFWRGSNTKNADGSGLGLYIARELIHLMDGEIFASKQNDEMSVSIVLPMV